MADDKMVAPSDEKMVASSIDQDSSLQKGSGLSVEDRDALKLEAALGHKQVLNRTYGLFSLTSLGIVIAK